MTQKKMNREAHRKYSDKSQEAEMKICFNEPFTDVNDVFFDMRMKEFKGGDEVNVYMTLKPHQVEDLIKQLTAMINYPYKTQSPSDIAGAGFLT